MVAAAVIIHLAADGTGYIDQTQCNITVQLVDTKDQTHSLGLYENILQICGIIFHWLLVCMCGGLGGRHVFGAVGAFSKSIRGCVCMCVCAWVWG